MAKVWVRAKGVIYVNENGQRVTKRAGEWAEVGKHQARMLLASGQAEIPKANIRNDVQVHGVCGVLIRSSEIEDLTPLGDMADNLRIVYDVPSVPFPYTAIWKPPARINRNAIKIGLMRLQSFEGTDAEPWEILGMLAGDDVLARDMGSDEERAKTKRMIGDLRLPIYDTGLLWVRQTPATGYVMRMWADELAHGADEQHSFLRAIYSARILLCTLPPRWQEHQ